MECVWLLFDRGEVVKGVAFTDAHAAIMYVATLGEGPLYRWDVMNDRVEACAGRWVVERYAVLSGLRGE